MARLDPPQSPEERAAVERIASDADVLPLRQRERPLREIVGLLGDAFARERRQAVNETLAVLAPEMKRLCLIEKAALAVAVKYACGDGDEAILAEVAVLRETIGEDVIEAALVKLTAMDAGLEEPQSGEVGRW